MERNLIPAFHGLEAYSGKRKSFNRLLRDAEAAASGVEICVAERPIGKMGLVLSGEFTAMFDKDCHSAVSSDGTRFAQDKTATRLQTPRNEEDFIAAVAVAKSLQGKDYTYSEAWMISGKVQYVWLLKGFDDIQAEIAQDIADYLGARVVEVAKGSVSWDAEKFFQF